MQDTPNEIVSQNKELSIWEALIPEFSESVTARVTSLGTWRSVIGLDARQAPNDFLPIRLQRLQALREPLGN